MFEFTNKLDPQCHYFNLLSLQLFLQLFLFTWGLEQWLTDHHSHRNCCMWGSAVLFAFLQSPDKMGVDKARERKKNCHSSISLQLHPQIEKAPGHPPAPRRGSSYQWLPPVTSGCSWGLGRGFGSVGHRLQPSLNILYLFLSPLLCGGCCKSTFLKIQ